MTASLRRRAVEWHIRLRHGDDATWEAFAGWIAENPLHEQAYDEIEKADLAIEPLLAGIQFREAVNDTADAGSAEEAEHSLGRLTPARRWGLAGGMLAAGIAAAIVIAPQFRSSRYDIDTGPGERREIALDVSTRIILNGSTRMTLDHKDARFAALDHGEALFHVRHDPAQPFRLQVGDARVQDVGTVFEVVRATHEVRVAVAEGSVSYAYQGAVTPLGAGQALVDRGGAIQLSSPPIGSVGGWQGGRFVYSAQPLSRVAEDLSRFLGVDIVVVPTLAGRLFSGAVILGSRGTATDQRQHLAAALDVVLEPGSRGWTMKPPPSAGH